MGFHLNNQLNLIYLDSIPTDESPFFFFFFFFLITLGVSEMKSVSESD